MDVRRATEPDLSTYMGVDMNPVLGALFWGAFLRERSLGSAQHSYRDSRFNDVSLDVTPTNSGPS